MSALALIVALLRGGHLAALVSLFGTLVFLTIGARAAMAEAGAAADGVQHTLLRLARYSAGVALVLGVAWLVTETAAIAGADSFRLTAEALPVVALQTQFGQIVLLRCGLLLATLCILGLPRLGLVIGGVLASAALALQPLLGHAGAVGGSLGNELIASEMLHLLAAGAWLGGLLPLFISVGRLPHNAAATASRSFTPLGLAAVLVLAGTAIVQVAAFMGGLPGLFGTEYGRIALVKLAVFTLLLTLAALNRFALTDRLDGSTSDAARRMMRLSIATEALLGALVIITAGFLASHTPGTHEQPVWPFAWRPSLDALAEPELQQEVLLALAVVAGGVVVAGAGLIWRRIRWPALVLGVIIAASQVPHFSLLFLPAYPTSYYTSPTEFAATAIVHGATLFAAQCANCHGPDGLGDGAAGATLPIRPADLTAEHLWAHSDGEMFWYLSHGYPGPDGGLSMPGFAGTLSSEARWDLIDYLRAHNAGESMRHTGKWSHPIAMPQFDATCTDGRTIDLDDLRGKLLLVQAVSGTVPPAAVADTAVTRILLVKGRPATPDGPACVATEPATWTAFAILLGVAPDALAGTQVLVDQNDWLRLAWHPGDASIPAATVREVEEHPLPLDIVGGHVHRH
jgi:putative copper export protein/mono/diheme cytochrome c family protein